MKNKSEKKKMRDGFGFRLIFPIWLLLAGVGLAIDFLGYFERVYNVKKTIGGIIISLSFILISILLCFFAVEGKKYKWVNVIYIILGILFPTCLSFFVFGKNAGVALPYFYLWGVLAVVGGIKGIVFLKRQALEIQTESNSNEETPSIEEASKPSDGE